MSRGWTLIEVLVALLLLSAGALTLAGGIAQAHRARALAVRESLALIASESWIETWRARPWTGEVEETIAVRWGPISGTVSGISAVVAPCVAEVRVEARVGSIDPASARLVTRRFDEGATDC